MKKSLLAIAAASLCSAYLSQAQPAASAPVASAAPTASATVTSNTPVVAAPPRPNTAIMPQLSGGFMNRHTNFVEIAKKGDIDILFMGDSITDFWRSNGRRPGSTNAEPAPDTIVPLAGKAVFEKHFGSMKIANFGIAGDTTQGVLWRLENGEGQGYKPKGIMLMIGTNNTGRNTPPEIAMGIADVVFELRKDFPDAKILLLGVFPRSTPAAKVRGQIDEINKIIATLHDNKHVFYEDIGSKFLSEDGSIAKDVMSDGLHPTSKGYEIWANAVEGTIAGFLK